MTAPPEEKPTKTHRVHPLVRAIVWICPPIYNLYMHFVFLTSKRVFYNYDSILDLLTGDSGILGAMWHQDVMIAPYTFRNHNVVTMVSKSDFGEIMALIAKRMGFTPVRGGSSMAGAEALSEVIDYVRTHEKIFFGLTVDGSRGPRYKVKKGIIVIAKETGVPIYPVRAIAKRKAHLGTWDKTTFPFPFNEFAFFFGNPIPVPKDATMDEVDAKRQELEDELMRLVERGKTHFVKGQPRKEYPGESMSIHKFLDKAGHTFRGDNRHTG